MGFLKRLFFKRMSSTAVAEQETTNVVGYFNPNTWKVQVAISELNMAITLEPMGYIEDQRKRKYNDPLLERFVGPKMLQKELSDKPVPIRRITPVQVVASDARKHVVGQGQRDERGKWQPPSPNQTVTVTGAPTASASNPSVQGMSIEEAKKRGFIGKQRIVPEDYGADETAGAPTRGDVIPHIKASFEAPAPMAKLGALPKELIEDVRPDLKGLVDTMSKAVVSDPEAAPNLGQKSVEKIIKAEISQEKVGAFKKALAEVKAVQPVEPRKALQRTVVIEENEAQPEPEAEAAVPAGALRHVCPDVACGKSFRFPSQLKAHVSRKHPQLLAQISG